MSSQSQEYIQEEVVLTFNQALLLHTELAAARHAQDRADAILLALGVGMDRALGSIVGMNGNKLYIRRPKSEEVSSCPSRPVDSGAEGSNAVPPVDMKE